MTHYIDLLSIQTAKHLRQGFEKRVRFDGGHFEVNIFETFQSSTKVKITYEGLSISGMIRGRKVVQTESGEVLDFVPGTSLILHEGQSILADFPDAGPHTPVQCVTVLIPQEKLVEQVDFLRKNYPDQVGEWDVEQKTSYFYNNSSLVRSFNELIQVVMQPEKNPALNDLLFKTFLILVMEAQKDRAPEVLAHRANQPLVVVKNFIQKNLDKNLSMELLAEVGNCSKSKLYRLFDEYCQLSPGAYVLKERMAYAQNLLLQPDSNISDVAYALGYSSVSYFVKQFKAVYHYTPGEYVKKFGV